MYEPTALFSYNSATDDVRVFAWKNSFSTLPTSGDLLDYEVEIDTVNTFDSVDYRKYVRPPKTLFYCNFDNNLMDTITGQTGTFSPSGSVSYVTGHIGQAVDINAGTLVYNTTDIIQPSGGTLEFWFQSDSTSSSGDRYLFEIPNTLRSYYNKTLKQLSFDSFDTTTYAWQSLTVPNISLWSTGYTYLAFTYDNTIGKAIYVNGAQAASGTDTWTYTTSGTELYIGSVSPSGNNADGAFDEFKIIISALPEAEILKKYTSTEDVVNFQSGYKVKGMECRLPSRTESEQLYYWRSRVSTFNTEATAGWSDVLSFAIDQNWTTGYRDSYLESLAQLFYETEDENSLVYKIYNMLAQEMDGLRLEVKKTDDDNGLLATRDASLYNNFGSLVELPDILSLQWVEYKYAIQKLLPAFLRGGTVQSMKDVIEALAWVDCTITYPLSGADFGWLVYSTASSGASAAGEMHYDVRSISGLYTGMVAPALGRGWAHTRSFRYKAFVFKLTCSLLHLNTADFERLIRILGLMKPAHTLGILEDIGVVV